MYINDDDEEVITGGSGIGYNSTNPTFRKSESVSGGVAFISDLYSGDPEMLGSHPTNRRIRWTLTLDKIIGNEGTHKFHT